jgi:hypothetical protein
VQRALRGDERHACQLADRPYGVEMTQQQHLAGSGAKARNQMIASRGAEHGLHEAAHLPQSLRQHRPAAIDSGLVVGRRFEGDQRFNDLEHPGLVGAAVLEKGRPHGASL